MLPPWCAKTPAQAIADGAKPHLKKVRVNANRPWVWSNGFHVWLKWAIPVEEQLGLYIHQTTGELPYRLLGTPQSAGCIRVSHSVACSLWQTVRVCGGAELAIVGEAPESSDRCNSSVLRSEEVQATRRFRKRLYDSFKRHQLSDADVERIYTDYDYEIKGAADGSWPAPRQLYWEQNQGNPSIAPQDSAK